MTRHNPTPEVSPNCERFYCPWCGAVVAGETAYDHSFDHQDVAPYSHLVTEEFWGIGPAAHSFAEGVMA